MATAVIRHRKRRRCPKGRTLHLIDIENLCGGTTAGDAAVAEAVDRYRKTIRVAEDDHIIVGSGPTFLVAAKLAWPAAQVVLGRGIDGADRALLHAAEPSFVVDHYDRVVIGSGDHAFAELVVDLRAHGTAVCIVTRDATSGSSTLRRLAHCRPLSARGVVPPA